MIKNIIFDVSGILFDDSKESITKLLGKDSTISIKPPMAKTLRNAY